MRLKDYKRSLRRLLHLEIDGPYKSTWQHYMTPEEFKNWKCNLDSRKFEDPGRWFGILAYSIKWFFIWTFKGVLVGVGLLIALFALLALSMGKANPNGTINKE